MTGEGLSAPKADALPDCATPRRAEARRFPGDSTQAETPVRGNERRNEAGTGDENPGIVPERDGERPNPLLSELLEAAEGMFPDNINIMSYVLNDDMIVPLDVTVRELRALRAAIAKARGIA